MDPELERQHHRRKVRVVKIDYESTANNMKADYTEVEYDGDTYYAR